MNCKPLEDFYVVVKLEEEAREVVDRAIAHGATYYEVVTGYGEGCEHDWDEFGAWGVHCDVTSTEPEKFFEEFGVRQLTIEQLREECPFVSELNNKIRVCAMELDIDELNPARRALAIAELSEQYETLTSKESEEAADKLFSATDKELAVAYTPDPVTIEKAVRLNFEDGDFFSVEVVMFDDMLNFSELGGAPQYLSIKRSNLKQFIETLQQLDAEVEKPNDEQD